MECSLGKTSFAATGCIGAATLGLSMKGAVTAVAVGSSLACPVIGVIVGVALVVFSGYKLYKAIGREEVQPDPATVRVLRAFSQPEDPQPSKEQPSPVSVKKRFKHNPSYKPPKPEVRTERSLFRWEDTAAIAASLATLLFIGFLL